MRRTDPWISRHPSVTAAVAGLIVVVMLTVGAFGGPFEQVSPRTIPYLVLVFGFVATLLRLILLPSRYPSIRARGGAGLLVGLSSLFLITFAALSSLSTGFGLFLSAAGTVLLGLAGLALQRRP